MEFVDHRLSAVSDTADKTKEGESKQMKMADIDMKLFFDQFFDDKSLEIVKGNFEHYDIRNHQKNSSFIQYAFRQAPSTLPVQNLGELSFLLQRSQEAFSYLDMSLKMFVNHDQ